ncbi:hypothetical protein AYO21_04632 [Fonsecaea monophora]|uniref:PWI domain-containing protein n=1 Tax=Fonsecaea monophora TaxID=254056 RepID=A0A177FCS0_9EURO|nr:hypothetical protein AYO21_04632 [Fonsecaea monophora]KAH0837174.1 RNA-binding protein RBM25 [Fonsecaea pedrosoi]OAG41252.1 hypothetical protein AYO21_04632 [Fonsecaea monophora]
MYNPPYQASGQYGAPGDYTAFPGAPPGMGPPPGMAAPGMGAPPGIQQQEAHQPVRPGSFPPTFQPPPNMPNINFSAPVIRLGTSGPSKPDTPGGREDRERGGRRPGLGAGQGSDFRGERDRITQIQPPTKEEIIKTIYVGGITEGAGGDEGIERILNSAGSLRRWVRATDADGKPCKFGFAEYEDPESLSTAIEVLRDIEVPVKRQIPAEVKDNEDVEVEMSKLVIVADENSRSYIEQWQESQGGRDTEQVEMRLDHARSALDAVLKDLCNPTVQAQKDEMSSIDREGDVSMTDGANAENATGDVVTIPIAIDDELSDIPAEMRETVAKEIAAFRDRSNRRDLERMKREEEIEQQERNRMMNGDRFNRLASPPPSAPVGPAGTNGIPIGPRGAPAGPKGFGVQIPREYQKGVVFNGTTISGASAFEDDDTDASDEELERRRKERRDAELEKQFLDQERRWLNRERSRTEAVERVKKREKDDAGRLEEEKEAMRKRLHDWNDDTEASRRTEEYYADRSMWIRNRASFRQREMANDEADRAAEQRERARELHQRERVDAMADDFLSRQEREMLNREQDRQEEDRAQPSRREPARFKLSLGAAAQKAAAQSASQVSKRTVADVEGLLEDEEEESKAGTRRTLIPIEYDASTTAGMSEEERAQAARQLAADIPNDKDGLWTWDVKWEFVDESIIEERLKPFVEKKIVEYLGVQEQMLVDVVVDALRSRGKPQDLVGELEGALDEEAEVLVRKLWRMLIFFSESEKRGLAA